MIIRSCQLDDAAGMVELTEVLAQETSFMLMEPGESKRTVEEERKWIERILSSEDDQLYVAEKEDQVVGFISGYRRPLRRVRHRLYLVLGIRQSHWGQGIGKRFLETMQAWAQSRGLRRLELTVLADNQRAIRLYQGVGFQKEGIRKKSMFVSGEYKDEWYMGKLLGERTDQ